MMTSLRQTIRTLLPRPLRQKARAAVWHFGDIRYGLRTGHWDLPPAYLRVKVCGTIAPDNYAQSGESNAQLLLDLLRRAGANTEQFRSILDFGCGCGRILTALSAHLPQAHFTGTDAEADLIAWPSVHLPKADFGVNAPEPPLSYADNQFDFIYAFSVFTHLDERQQFLWLEELQRVAKPGAYLIFTVHGTTEEEKFAFVKNDAWSDFFPDHYQTTFHARSYVMEHWSRYFTVLDYAERAASQDAVVLRKL